MTTGHCVKSLAGLARYRRSPATDSGDRTAALAYWGTEREGEAPFRRKRAMIRRSEGAASACERQDAARAGMTVMGGLPALAVSKPERGKHEVPEHLRAADEEELPRSEIPDQPRSEPLGP